MQKDLALLGIYAHPDDEQLITGTLAQCASEGIRTGLVCATRGEAGQMHESVGANRDTIGQVREAELRAAAVVVGVKSLWFLDYCDSGWFGSPDNERPQAFANSSDEEALGKIVRIIREFRPTIITTFDPRGAYGHIDHLKIHKLAVGAFSAAADPHSYPDVGEPWQTSRLYYSIFPTSLVTKMHDHLRVTNPDDEFLKIDFQRLGTDDLVVTNEVDVHAWLEVKDRSLRCHRTQQSDYERWRHLPADLTESMRGTEYFILALGAPLPDTPGASGDLFAGLRTDEI
jgi:LmbE family N-acetylglucosaminyl deacetylase